MITEEILIDLGVRDITQSIDKQLSIDCFNKMVEYIKRPGIDRLVKFIRDSDYETAPSSTRFHNNYPGGLLDHMVKVTKIAILGAYQYNKIPNITPIPLESVIISALFHDLCKLNFYIKKPMKTKKGDQWIDYVGYEVNDGFPFGHGEKSVFYVSQFIQLFVTEIMAIRWHMGMMDNGKYSNLAQETAFNNYPLVTIVHSADMQSSFLYEKIYDLSDANYRIF